MKRLLVSVITCLVVVLTVVSAAYAAPLTQFRVPTRYLADVPAPVDKDLMTQLETEILPQLEHIFTSEQREQFKTNIANGTSFRKAFKSLLLTPEQKTQLKTLLKSVSKKDAFASLTPEQKKQLFLKKKEMFMPTSEEITDKTNASMKEKGTVLSPGVKEKIDAGIKKKDTAAPTCGGITQAIEAGMNELKSKMAE